MPVKTITAEIDGQVRKIRADIPDSATPAQIQDAVRAFLAQPPARDPNELPGYAEAEAFVRDFKHPGLGGVLKDTAAMVGEAVISPIAGIPGAISEVAEYVSSGFRPPALTEDGGLRPAGFLTDKTGEQMLGNAAMAGLAGLGSKGGPLPKAKAAMDRLGVPTETPAPQKATFSGKLPGTVSEGIGILRTLSKLRPSRLLDSAIDYISGAMLEKLEATPPKVPAPPPQATAPAPAPAYTTNRLPAPAIRAEMPAAANPGPVARAAGPMASAGPALPKTSPGGPVLKAPAAPAEAAAPAPARGKGIAQASKDARTLADKLLEWKFSPDEVQAMNERVWAKLAHDSGVPMPTEATRRSAIFDLKKKLAGPPRTLPELVDSLKESLGMDVAPQKVRSILDANPNAKPADAARIVAEQLRAEMEASGTLPPAEVVEISKPKPRRTKK